MDKYAPYVFSAYGVAIGLLAATAIGVVVRLILAQRLLKAIEKDQKA
tara:strand:- start:68 stop:208 length:141 start_codon:yes stop_codon:yes gene_type:complete